MCWELQDGRVEYGQQILVVLISASPVIHVSGTLLGAVRFPRNFIIGVRWCPAARSIMDALIAVSASWRNPCVKLLVHCSCSWRLRNLYATINQEVCRFKSVSSGKVHWQNWSFS